jgi:hypothetical protein
MLLYSTCRKEKHVPVYLILSTSIQENNILKFTKSKKIRIFSNKIVYISVL